MCIDACVCYVSMCAGRRSTLDIVPLEVLGFQAHLNILHRLEDLNSVQCYHAQIILIFKNVISIEV